MSKEIKRNLVIIIILAVVIGGYAYLIYDYGNCADLEQLPADFYANDLRITVCGGNAEEVAALTTLSQTSISLTIGQTCTLSSTISPSNATNKSVTWTSSNSAVATVIRGIVKAQKAGTATVYARVVSPNLNQRQLPHVLFRLFALIVRWIF